MPLQQPLRGEFAFIDWIRRQAAADPRVPIGIGDDTAALRITADRQLLVTTDMILEGVHFDRSNTPMHAIGRKAMAVNLSDIAAMAGIPVAAVLSIALPPALPHSDAESLFRGVKELADEFQVALVGGDTNRSPSGLVLCVTLLGETTPRGAVRRSGARPGDWILVTGTLGGSIHQKHLWFTPRVREALALNERFALHAMIDVSDGLVADLGHILEESRCGAVIRAGSIPISDAAINGANALEHALGDGEDFELLITMPEFEARRVLSEQPLDVPITHLGEIIEPAALLLEDVNGVRRPIEPRGYDHFRS